MDEEGSRATGRNLCVGRIPSEEIWKEDVQVGREGSEMVKLFWVLSKVS